MKGKLSGKAKCVECESVSLPYHLCCRECRARIDSAARDALRKAGVAPQGCAGENVAFAPGRGPQVAFQPTTMTVQPDGDFKPVTLGHAGRSAMRAEDVFDRMALQSARRGGGSALDVRLVNAGRAYRDLFERCEAAGYKCASTFDEGRGAGGGDFMDAYSHDRAILRSLQSAVAEGVALPVRRVRPSVRGSKSGISNRALVDAVCLADKSLSEVLSASGWTVCSKARAALRAALSLNLERLARAWDASGAVRA